MVFFLNPVVEVLAASGVGGFARCSPCVSYWGVLEENTFSCDGEHPPCETQALRGYNGIARVPSPGRDTELFCHNQNTGESR